MKGTESWKDVNYHNSYTEKGTQRRPIPINEVESVINNLRNRKAAGPEGPTGKLYWTFKEEMIPVLYSLFQKIETERMLPASFGGQCVPDKSKTGQRKEKKGKPQITTDQYLS